MGILQVTGRTIGRTRRILTLAPGPVGSYPIGGCTARIHPSTSHCSLGCSRKPHLDFSNFPGTGSFAKVLATTAPISPFSACFTLETAPDLDFSNSRKSLYTGMTAKQPPKGPQRPSPSPWQTEHPTVLKRGQKTGRNACAPGPISRRGLGFRTPGFHHPRPTTRSDVAGTLARTASCTVQFLGTSPFAKVLATTPPDLHSSSLFHVGKGPRLVFLQLSQIPVHGYDSKTASEEAPEALSQPMADRPTGGPTILQRGHGTGRNACAPGPVSCRGLGFRTPGFHPRRALARFDAAPELTSVFGTHRNQPFRQSARRTGFTSPFSFPFQVAYDPAFPFSEVTPIPVHGYDSGSRRFPPAASKGGTRESSQMRHGVPLHGSPHSMSIRPAVTARFGLTQVRQ